MHAHCPIVDETSGRWILNHLNSLAVGVEHVYKLKGTDITSQWLRSSKCLISTRESPCELRPQYILTLVLRNVEKISAGAGTR